MLIKQTLFWEFMSNLEELDKGEGDHIKQGVVLFTFFHGTKEK